MTTTTTTPRSTTPSTTTTKRPASLPVRSKVRAGGNLNAI